jgi:hypothetical protein
VSLATHPIYSPSRVLTQWQQKNVDDIFKKKKIVRKHKKDAEKLTFENKGLNMFIG